METLAPLPIYPSTRARKAFSASQLAQFHANLTNALAQLMSLPPAKRDTPPTRAFISSYASDSARQILETLIWEDVSPRKQDDRLRQYVLLLAEKVASSPPGLEHRTLLDICVAFPSKITHLKAILSAALDGTPNLPTVFASDVVPAFTTMLSPSQSAGLYGLRKTVRCLTSLLRPSPPPLVRAFAHNREFIIALAHAYDDGLTVISRAYGGIRTGLTNRELDHWEHIWLDTKVDMIDAFHLIVMTMVHDMSTASGPQLASEAERAFGIVFALLDMAPQAAAADAVPFLNRPLVSDYQYAYDLNETLSRALRHASREDARMGRLDAALRALDVAPSSGQTKDPGALRLILRSSSVAPQKAVPSVRPVSTDKGKAKAAAPKTAPAHDDDLDLRVTQVLDIFPSHSSAYIRKLLTHPSLPFRGNAERVIEALLEGTAPNEGALEESAAETFSVVVPATDVPIERRNVFDEEVMDLSRVHIGKKKQDAGLTRDSAEIQRMKAEILRLAEAMAEDSDEESRAKALDMMDLDDDLDEAGATTIKVLGDGEDSGDDEDDEERGVDPIQPETVLELAYIRDPKLFDREARKSKQRADLKQQIGWTDEQVEGWRIMLERNPKKDSILRKHEFSGNKILSIPIIEGMRDESARGQRGGGRGRGRARGRGRGSGGEGRQGEKNNVARERASKERYKSSNRKREHDKKMTKAGAGPSA